MLMEVRPLTDRMLEVVDVEGPDKTEKFERLGPLKLLAWPLMVYVRLKFSPNSTTGFTEAMNSISWAERDWIMK